MRRINLILFVFSMLFLSCQVNGQNVERIGPEEFEKVLNDLSDPQLIDVRTPDEYEMGHLSGAKLIDFREKDFKTKMSTLDKTRPVLVYCAVGGRSGKAADMLKEMGFSQVYDLEGGINAWSGTGKEVER